MSTTQKDKMTMPAQHQDRQPGLESEMTPKPVAKDRKYKGSGKLLGKVAIITGGDSGIGRAAAACYAAEGADVAIIYLNEHDDAKETQRLVEEEGTRCMLIAGDIGQEQFCFEAVRKVVEKFGKLDILVNNAAEQHPQKSITEISQEQLERTFRTNIFSMFYMTKAAMPHLKEGAVIINTASITAYRGQPTLLDYSSTKGAIVAFTRSLSMNLADKGIRVNGVAPGPIWTPLIPSTFDAEKVAEFGGSQPMKRPGQPEELGPAYVFLASDDSSYMSGQFLHINGGEIING
ncbi:SDR family oxidoreductase [Paenibacillus caseinilyticus]|uniref:Short-chain dehydrogenase n=1 Tax=Paenibacillus mucilaginosus K02 TaxID=997761 RepID=I0BHR1_9BACL|nr:SDR family oxidoreductase [Paenibacillus mucilaginosus]AFH61908.1 short-chain dehydrogenase [Paenibacillus mucilaginosus K02]